MLFTLEIEYKLVTIDILLDYYNLEKIEGYCKNCVSYNKMWSCPPHDFDPYKYIKKYNYAYIISGKIILNKDEFNDNYKEQINEVFQNARIEFSDKLIDLEKDFDFSEALIAGKCYQCEMCTKEINKPCILKNKLRYSLESLGLIVDEITTDILKQEIKWIKDDIPDYLLAVGALLVDKEMKLNI